MKNILLIENLESDFFKSRLPLAKFLLKSNYKVFGLIPRDSDSFVNKEDSIQIFTYNLKRSNKGIIQILKLFLIYREVIFKNDINVVHSFRFQPNLVNVLANLFSKRKVVIHITGLGLAFSNHRFKYLVLQLLSQFVFQFKMIFADTIIFQNPDDVSDVWLSGLWKHKIHVITGSGVDIEHYNVNNYNKDLIRKQLNVSPNVKIFTCVSRLLWEKGIREMVMAFENIKVDNSEIQLWLVGHADKENPRSVDSVFIEKYKNNSIIKFMGKHSDVASLLAISDVFLYPSYYREGIPRAILEAMSMSLPIITTNTPGCNLTVNKPYNNGLLIQARSISDIIDSVNFILKKSDLKEMGNASRQLVINQFSNEIIFSQIKELYK